MIKLKKTLTRIRNLMKIQSRRSSKMLKKTKRKSLLKSNFREDRCKSLAFFLAWRMMKMQTLKIAEDLE